MARDALCLLAVLALGACGTNITPKQQNEACTRTSQCEVGLICLVGVCVPEPDAGVDGGSDAGS